MNSRLKDQIIENLRKVSSTTTLGKGIHCFLKEVSTQTDQQFVRIIREIQSNIDSSPSGDAETFGNTMKFFKSIIVLSSDAMIRPFGGFTIEADLDDFSKGSDAGFIDGLLSLLSRDLIGGFFKSFRETSCSPLEKSHECKLREKKIATYFEKMFRDTGLQQITMGLGDVLQELYPCDMVDRMVAFSIFQSLRHEFKLIQNPEGRYTYPVYDLSASTPTIKSISRLSGKPFVFKRADFVIDEPSQAEASDILKHQIMDLTICTVASMEDIDFICKNLSKAKHTVKDVRSIIKYMERGFGRNYLEKVIVLAGNLDGIAIDWD